MRERIRYLVDDLRPGEIMERDEFTERFNCEK